MSGLQAITASRRAKTWPVVLLLIPALTNSIPRAFLRFACKRAHICHVQTNDIYAHESPKRLTNDVPTISHNSQTQRHALLNRQRSRRACACRSNGRLGTKTLRDHLRRHATKTSMDRSVPSARTNKPTKNETSRTSTHQRANRATDVEWRLAKRIGTRRRRQLRLRRRKKPKQSFVSI